MKILAGKVAWITGGSSGIGLAAAGALGRLGARIVLSARKQTELQLAAQSLARQGVEVAIEALDVVDANACATVAQKIEDEFGSVDVLVNSAGMNIAKRSWPDVQNTSWEQVFSVNVHGSFYCIQAVLPGMRTRHDGLIINISSWAGRFDAKRAGPAYVSAKHAVSAMTRSLNSEEYVNGIRACALCPGEVATPIMSQRSVPPTAQELAQMLQPDDLAATVAFVASLPPTACVNEIVISPTKNGAFR